jgi:hypothetical protein
MHRASIHARIQLLSAAKRYARSIADHNGQDDGHTQGETAHFVRLARAMSKFTIEEIRS